MEWGCVAYWLLTGQHVFDCAERDGIVDQARVGGAPNLRPRSIPMSRRSWINWCCDAFRKDPADRPYDAVELGTLFSEIELPARWDNRLAEKWWKANMSNVEKAKAPSSDEELSQTIDLGLRNIDSLTTDLNPMCDGNPQYVEENLDEYIRIQAYCPWGSYVLQEIGRPE